MITRSDLNDRFGEFEIERLEKNIKDPQAVNKAIDDAVQFVNSYIASNYRLPLPSIPASVERACAVVARYYLYKDKPTATVRQDYDDILAWLKDVASGKVKLDFGEGDEQEEKTLFVSGAFVA